MRGTQREMREKEEKRGTQTRWGRKVKRDYHMDEKEKRRKGGCKHGKHETRKRIGGRRGGTSCDRSTKRQRLDDVG